MKKEDMTNFFKKSKEIIIFILLLIWIMTPLLRELTVTVGFMYKYHYTILIFIGVIGIYMLTVNIYRNFLRNQKNSKEYFKSILPIIIFLLYMIWTLISCFYSPNSEIAFIGTTYRLDGYATYLGYAGFFGLAFLLDSKKLKKILLNVFLIISMINIIAFELVNKGILIELLKENKIDTGVFYQFNHYGYYLLMATITANFLFITENKKVFKIIYGLVYCIFLYYLILNNTFGCYLALFATLILFLGYCIYKKQKRMLATISIILFIIMSFCVWKNGKNVAYENWNGLRIDFKRVETKIETTENIKKTNVEEEFDKIGSLRMKLWKNGIKFFLERPVLGYGPENLGSEYIKVGMVTSDRPHNLIIQLATTSGFPGLILYLSGIGIILIRALKTMQFENELQVIAFSVVIAYLISAMFGNSMYYTSPYFFIFLGFLMNENEKKREE